LCQKVIKLILYLIIIQKLIIKMINNFVKFNL
jgi:hypothetical protein